ncbi:phage tail protein [Pedobacter sp. SYSU D00535]|uniref:phage tail protein n=1 Tax=Pedobacter sp. SYSU D00535 TaxID=2810308 RepID=UPI001A96F9AA|nr:tail fiber protein [Pedobacter sp. SYSU D00535]
MEPYIGEIKMFGGNFAPRGWALCNGQLLSIAQNTALFSILGVTYGGNGQTTFALPNLMGRVPMHWGQGAGLTNRLLGETAGTETVTLLNSQMPAHNHLISASSVEGASPSPEGNYIASSIDPGGNPINAFATTPNTTMNVATVSASGGSQPHANMQPYQCVTFIIALEGIFPPRD